MYAWVVWIGFVDGKLSRLRREVQFFGAGVNVRPRSGEKLPGHGFHECSRRAADGGSLLPWVAIVGSGLVGSAVRQGVIGITAQPVRVFIFSRSGLSARGRLYGLLYLCLRSSCMRSAS